MKPLRFILVILLFFCRVVPSMGQETIADFSNVYLEKLIATAKENYPRMSAFESRIQIAKSSVSKEQISWVDAFTFGYVHKFDNTVNIVDPTLFDGYQVGATVNLSTLLQKPANVRQAKEELKIAEADLREYNLTLESEVKTRYFLYLQNLNNLRLLTKMVSDIQNVSKDMRSKYEKNEITFEQYNQSQVSLSTAIQQKITSEAAYLSAKASLEELLTKKIEEVQ